MERTQLMSSKNNEYEISIIVVNHNTKDLLCDCLSSILEESSDLSVEVIVVDNASVDGSVEAIREEFPIVKCIENSKNSGFAAANNQALGQSKAPFIIFLNPDTIVLPGMLINIKKAFDGNSNIGALGIRLLNPNHSIQPSWGRFSSAWTEFFFQSFLFKVFPPLIPIGKQVHPLLIRSYQHAHPVDWVSGACLAVRRSVLEKTGGFDENIFMYGEDIDLCWRIWKSGFQVWFWPGGEVIHFNKSASNRNYEYWITNYTQGVLYFYNKYRSRSTLVLCGLFICFGSILRQFLWSGIYVVDPKLRDEITQRIRGYKNATRLGYRAIIQL